MLQSSLKHVLGAFLVEFDVRKGPVLIGQYPESLVVPHLAVAKALPDGAHAVAQGFVYFPLLLHHGALVAESTTPSLTALHSDVAFCVCLFKTTPEPRAPRGSHSQSVGVLLRQGWLTVFGTALYSTLTAFGYPPPTKPVAADKLRDFVVACEAFLCSELQSAGCHGQPQYRLFGNVVFPTSVPALPDSGLEGANPADIFRTFGSHCNLIILTLLAGGAVLVHGTTSTSSTIAVGLYGAVAPLVLPISRVIPHLALSEVPLFTKTLLATRGSSVVPSCVIVAVSNEQAVVSLKRYFGLLLHTSTGKVEVCGKTLRRSRNTRGTMTVPATWQRGSTTSVSMPWSSDDELEFSRINRMAADNLDEQAKASLSAWVANYLRRCADASHVRVWQAGGSAAALHSPAPRAITQSMGPYASERMSPESQPDIRCVPTPHNPHNLQPPGDRSTRRLRDPSAASAGPRISAEPSVNCNVPQPPAPPPYPAPAASPCGPPVRAAAPHAPHVMREPNTHSTWTRPPTQKRSKCFGMFAPRTARPAQPMERTATTTTGFQPVATMNYCAS